MTSHPPEIRPQRRLSAENRREQIMETAARLFIQRGFEAVGMADVAQALGTSRPTVYSYFASTESILAALFAERLEHLPERLRPLLCGGQMAPYARIFEALVQERELLLLLGSGGGPLFRAHRQAFLDAIETRLNLRQLGQAKSASLGRPTQPLLLPLILNLLTQMAYEQVTRTDLDAQELGQVLERFVEGGVEAAVSG